MERFCWEFWGRRFVWEFFAGWRICRNTGWRLPHPSSAFLKMDLRGALHLGLVEIIFIFLFVDLFDNVGTMVGVCEQGGFVKDGKIPRVGRMLLAGRDRNDVWRDDGDVRR